ncbi:hypothetical protein S83_056492 [Arachis hypogaea]
MGCNKRGRNVFIILFDAINLSSINQNTELFIQKLQFLFALLLFSIHTLAFGFYPRALKHHKVQCDRKRQYAGRVSHQLHMA